MVKFIHFRDPHSEEMLTTLNSIPKSPGTCFFMDINRSTDLKYQGGIADWGRKLNNTFNFLLFANHFENYIVKGIGDEMMLFISDEELQASGRSFLSLLEDIYSSLYTIQYHPNSGLFLECKVAIHYCTEVYNITFFEGANDYYGSDIDLTARLMTKCIDRRIVMSEKFLLKIREDLAFKGLSEGAGLIPGISQRQRTRFKGVPKATHYHYIDVNQNFND